MPVFTYSAVDRAGSAQKGAKAAENEKALAQALKGEGLFLLEAEAEKDAVWLRGVHLRDLSSRIFPISLVEKMFFARNLAVMIDAGLSLTRALSALGEETSNVKLRVIIREVNEGVAKGQSFADALRMHESVFGNLFISMIEVGEATGKLATVLRVLARQMKKDHDIRGRVKGAMVYPAVIFMVLVGVGVLMMIYVVPSLVATIKELGADLPLSTRVVIRASEFFTRFGVWMFFGGAAAVFVFWRILKTDAGKRTFDRFILKFPMLGPLVKKFNAARFSRILSYLVSAGVPIVHALDITAAVLGNSLFRDAVKEAAGEVERGKQLNITFARYPALFPPMVIQMIAVGEETGKISSMLLRLALFFEEEVTATTKNLSTIIEPVLMVIIGVIVGFFAISMFQPIYGSLGNI